MTINTNKKNFIHIQGKDCITSCLRNLIHYYGINLHESMVFGIGMGLRFWYCELEDNAAFPIMIGQDAEIEKIFCRNLGLNFSVQQDYSGDQLKKRIDAKLPTIVKADPYYLPYCWLDTQIEPMHFGEHVALLVNYDSTHVYISDIWNDNLVQATHAEFLQARTASEGLPYLLPHARWFDIEKPACFDFDLNNVSLILYKTCSRHLYESKPYGIAGIRQAAEELPEYLYASYKKSISETVYILYSIAIRMYEGDEYTMFRKIFFSFIKTYSTQIETNVVNIAHLEESIIYAWEAINKLLNELAVTLPETNEENVKNSLKLLKNKLLHVADLEESMCQTIMQQLQNKSKNYETILLTSIA